MVQLAPEAGSIVQCAVDASRANWRRPSVLRKPAGYGSSPQRSNLWPSPAPRIQQGEIQPPTSHTLPIFASTFHKVPDTEKGANRPGFHLRDCSMKRRGVSQIALQHLMTMWTGVSIEIIAKLDATDRTFFRKHNSAEARKLPPLASYVQQNGVQRLMNSGRLTGPGICSEESCKLPGFNSRA